MPFAPAAHTGQQPALRERWEHRHAQPLRRAAGGGRGGLHAVVELRERALHAAQQDFAGGVEHHAASAPLEDIETQLLLQHADLLADCAMGDVQDFGSGAQVQQFGDGAKRGQGVQGQACHAGKYTLP